MTNNKKKTTRTRSRYQFASLHCLQPFPTNSTKSEHSQILFFLCQKKKNVSSFSAQQFHRISKKSLKNIKKEFNPRPALYTVKKKKTTTTTSAVMMMNAGNSHLYTITFQTIAMAAFEATVHCTVCVYRNKVESLWSQSCASWSSGELRLKHVQTSFQTWPLFFSSISFFNSTACVRLNHQVPVTRYSSHELNWIKAIKTVKESLIQSPNSHQTLPESCDTRSCAFSGGKKNDQTETVFQLVFLIFILSHSSL